MSDPTTPGGVPPSPLPDGFTLRDWYAAHVDLSWYNPREMLATRLGRAPQATELAQYIAEIRLMEADAIISARDNP